MQIYFILDNKQRLLQGTTMYESLDVDVFKSYMHAYNPNIQFITHNTLINNENYFYSKDNIIIYTSSQVKLYKQYVEHMMYHFNQTNTLIPSIDALYAHENKSFEYIWLKANYKNLQSYIFADKQSYLDHDISYPIVLKLPTGSSSRGVKICKNESQAKRFINTHGRKQLISELVTTPLVQWAHHIKDTRNNLNFVAQEIVEDYKGDYRVQVMGDKFFVYFRELLPNKKYTSGSGSKNIYNCAVPEIILNTANMICSKINSPIIIFDIIHNKETNSVNILEFSAIHPSNVAIDHCDTYYTILDGEWVKHKSDFNREKIHAEAYIHQLKKQMNN